MDKIRKRLFPDKNYSAIWFKDQTLRIPINSSKPILELDYPEFYDVKITNTCSGRCVYCYQDSNDKEEHYSNILPKLFSFFGTLTKNQKPFQVAIGGGNPNEHPDFIEVLKLFHSLDITPNYTTNGIGITSNILKATKEYCGGVAITCHPHLLPIWEESANKIFDKGIKLNFHILIGNDDDIKRFTYIYQGWKDKVEYFVLLPLTEVGRAKNITYDKEGVANKLIKTVEELNTIQVAFGANYYPYLCNRKTNLDISLYEPEILSKYLDLKDMKVYKSSFNLEEVKTWD